MANLRDLWGELRGTASPTRGAGYRLRLLETHGEARLWAAVTEASLSPAVILEIPQNARPRSQIAVVTKTFECVIADFSGLAADRIGIAIVLRDPMFEDLFGVFGDEIVMTVRQSAGTAEAARAAGRCIARWRRFTERHRGTLGDDAVQGLIGELVVLARCIGRLGPAPAVTGWVGPQNALRDFELPDASVEVKTYRSDSGATIRINDPQQLDDEGARPVFVAAVRVARMESAGLQLPEFIRHARDLVLDSADVLDVFDERVAAAGYLPAHAAAYTDRFIVEHLALYRVRPGFPRVRAAEVPAGVVNVHFSIQLAALEEFAVEPVGVIGERTAGIEGGA
jgi:hypothetical protein